VPNPLILFKATAAPTLLPIVRRIEIAAKEKKNECAQHRDHWLNVMFSTQNHARACLSQAYLLVAEDSPTCAIGLSTLLADCH